MKPRVEIIVLKYKRPDVESECAKRLIEHTDWPYKLVFYDTRDIPCHFSKFWNQLIRESTCEYVCIMDSDAYVTEGWLTKMMSVFDKRQDVALVVPVTENVGTPSQIGRSGDTIEELEMASPVVGLYKKDIFEKVGWFDESPEFAIFGQDAEWIRRATRKKFKTYLHTGVFVNHIGNASTKKASDEGEFSFDEERTKAAAKFKEKYNE